jgi:hypothetical protein
LLAAKNDVAVFTESEALLKSILPNDETVFRMMHIGYDALPDEARHLISSSDFLEKQDILFNRLMQWPNVDYEKNADIIISENQRIITRFVALRSSIAEHKLRNNQIGLQELAGKIDFISQFLSDETRSILCRILIRNRTFYGLGGVLSRNESLFADEDDDAILLLLRSLRTMYDAMDAGRDDIQRDTTYTYAQMAVLGILIAKNGGLAQSKLIDDLLVDVFSEDNSALQYEILSSGTWHIKSVGSNKIDDGYSRFKYAPTFGMQTLDFVYTDTFSRDLQNLIDTGISDIGGVRVFYDAERGFRYSRE